MLRVMLGIYWVLSCISLHCELYAEDLPVLPHDFKGGIHTS